MAVIHVAYFIDFLGRGYDRKGDSLTLGIAIKED